MQLELLAYQLSPITWIWITTQAVLFSILFFSYSQDIVIDYV